MNRRPHPIDDVFRQKLEQHASSTPEHLWAGIVRQQNLHRKLHLRRRERVLLAAVLLLFAYASLLTWQLRQLQPAQPLLGSFPVNIQPKSKLQQANSLPNNPQNIAAAAPSIVPVSIKKVENATAATPVHPLPTMPAEVESLTTELTATIQKISDEAVGTPTVSAMTALQISALPLALQRVRYRQQPLFDYSKCAAFNENQPSFYFDLLASPDVAFRKIQPRTGDFEDYAISRKETEAARYNYSIGARLSVVSNSGLALRGGLNYSEINERFEFLTGTRIVITYDQNGNILGSPDTISETIVNNNRYQTLDIPVMVGYEIPIKKFTLAFNGGAYFNINFKPEGEFLSPYDNRPISFSNEDTPENKLSAFRENLGIGWYGSMGVSYKVSPRSQLLVEPHLKMYPRSFTRDDFMTDQRYLTAGVFVGLRHQFSL